MIKKIEIENFGSLVSFSNLEAPFSSSDAIIHGMNGCGKSQICNALCEISLLNKSKSLPDAQREVIEQKVADFISSRLSKEATSHEVAIKIDQYSLFIDTITKVIREEGNAPKVFVFNEQYVNENVSDVVSLPDQEIKIGKKNIERDLLIHNIRKTEKAIKNVDEEISRLVKSCKESSGYAGQSRTDRIITKENYLNPTNPGENNPDARESLDKIAIPPEPIKSHLSLHFPNIRIDDPQSSRIDEIFNTKYIEPKLFQDIYKRYILSYKAFYENGLELFSNLKTKCPFCLSTKSPNDTILNELKVYIESEYNSCLSLLDGLTSNLKKNMVLIDTFLSNWNMQVQQVNEKLQILNIDKSITPIAFEKDLFDRIFTLIDLKKNNMEKTSLEMQVSESVINLYHSCLEELKMSYQKHIDIINNVNLEIDKISTKKRELGEKIIKHHMFTLWNNMGLREKFVTLKEEHRKLREDLNQMSQTASNDKTADFFNQIIQLLGVYKYELNEKSNILLKLEDSYDISKEGFRISTGERKFIALSYFLAEVLASVSTSAELHDVTVAIDDPVDSSDYLKFYSFISLVENMEGVIRNIFKNDEIILGQFLIFTHNALLFERLVNKDGRDCFLLSQEDNKTVISKPKNKASLTTFSTYIRKVTTYIRRMRNPKNPEIGNYIRRILEIISSVENIDSNKIGNLNESSKLNAIANHLSHESIERMLDPLPESHEYIEACIELIEEIKKRIPNLYKRICEKYHMDEISEYRRKYEYNFLHSQSELVKK